MLGLELERIRIMFTMGNTIRIRIRILISVKLELG